MRAVIALLILSLSAFSQTSVVHYSASGNPYPVWTKYTVTAVANGASGCATVTGCWVVNGASAVDRDAALTQTITLFQLPAKGFVHNARIKSATACTGVTTLTTSLGVTGTDTFFISTLYDLMAAVSATNLTNALLLKVGSSTASAVNVTAPLIATGIGKTMQDVVDGCSFTAWIEWSVLP
jgi:hypothetical protein